jgi:hypothetical protein
MSARPVVRVGVRAAGLAARAAALTAGGTLCATGFTWRSAQPAPGPPSVRIAEAAADFSIDGRSLGAFLDWYARAAGLTVVFVAPASRAAVDRTILRGSIAGLTPAQALDAVMATTRFRYDASVPGELRIYNGHRGG